MIFLERDQIAELIDLSMLAPAIEDAYRASSSGEINLPPVGHITFPELDGDCHIKYGHQQGQSTFVIKVATGFPRNDPTIAPTGNGVSLVLSAETGETEAILYDRMLLTDVRTAIGAAIASRTLAAPSASRVLIVGTGAQAEHQVAAHRALFDQELDISLWGRSPDKAQVIAERMGIRAEPDLASGCRSAGIIVTATGARTPIIDDSWIEPGTHITAVGADAPGKHELDPILLKRADRLVADSSSQCLHHGEFSALPQHRHNDVVELGTLLNHPTERSAEHITVVDLTGTAAQDIAVAQSVLDAHRRQRDGASQ